MTSLADLANAHPVIGKRWSQGPSPEQLRILGLARDALDFIFATGQRYVFEDFFKRTQPSRPTPTGENPDLRELMDRTKRFFEKLRDEPESGEEVTQSQAILDAIHYIESTCQQGVFAVFQEHVGANAPPYVVAAFDTREAAEAWLASHSHPPDPAHVLIANEYHDVVHDRETNIRRLPRNSALEWYLTELQEKESPIAVASFETLKDADAWWREQVESTRRAWVHVGGELHLAVYYPNIHYRTLFPLSVANSQEERQAMSEER